MAGIDKTPDMYKGLQKDPISGHYRVLPGYQNQALRYRINETWLDEDDNLWIDAAAVEKKATEGSRNHQAATTSQALRAEPGIYQP